MCRFLLEQKEQRGQEYKKERRRERERGGERSLGAGGDLLQVLDTLLVNQTDSEGGQVEDEALAQLDGHEDTNDSLL